MLTIAIDKNTPLAEEAFRPLGNVRLLETGGFSQRELRDVDVLIVRSETKVDATLLDGTPVKFVGTVTIGTDHVDIAHLASAGIGFASAPGSNANSVNEYVVAALLHLAGRFEFGLKGKIVGVVGVGNIGSKVVRSAEALGMTVLQNDPPLARLTGEKRFLPLDDLMDADICTLHVPLTTSGTCPTFHLFDSARIRRMKPGAVLINTSRGPVAETGAILDALRDGHCRGAVLDVWENEPAISPALLEQVTVGTPHIAGYSLDGKVNAVRMVRNAVCGFFGLAVDWDPSEMMPRPRSPRIDLSSLTGDDEKVIRQAVDHCYSLEEDDRNLRELLSLSPERRAPYFSLLRKRYRLRREFPAYTVHLPEKYSRLLPALKGIGFVPS